MQGDTVRSKKGAKRAKDPPPRIQTKVPKLHGVRGSTRANRKGRDPEGTKKNPGGAQGTTPHGGRVLGKDEVH